MAKSLDIQVIAEYVENRKIQKSLESIGCINYQGYFYSPAVSADELETAIRKFDDKRKSE